MEIINGKHYLTVEEVAARLGGKTRQNVYQMIDRETLPAQRISKRVQRIVKKRVSRFSRGQLRTRTQLIRRTIVRTVLVVEESALERYLVLRATGQKRCAERCRGDKTFKEAAGFLGMHESSISQMVKRGDLPVHLHGSCRLVKTADLHKIQQKRAGAPPQGDPYVQAHSPLVAASV